MADGARINLKACAPCAIGALLTELSTLFFNGAIDAAQGAVADSFRDWATLAQFILLALLALVSRHAPRLVRPRPAACLAAAFLVVGAPLAWLGTTSGSAPVMLVGACLSGMARAWASVLFVVLCSRLDMRSLVVGITCGTVAAIPACAGFSALGYTAALACDTAASLCLIALCTACTRENFAAFAQAEPAADAQLTRPRSVLPLGHDLFVYTFLFCLSYGFALRYDHVDGGVLANGVNAATFAALAAYAVLATRQPRVDVLFDVAFVLVLGGFLLVLLDDAGLNTLASIVLTTSNGVFGILLSLALAGVVARNRSNALPAAAWGYATYHAGIAVGAQLGLFATNLPPEQHLLAKAIAAVLLGAICVYTLFSIRDFGFDKTIADMEPDAPAPQDQGQLPVADAVERRCAELAAAHALTEREGEVFALLARGNNAAHVVERLGISKNTLKYHVRHIYEKLGVHSQQELIDLL